MFDFFKKHEDFQNPLVVDLHSHLIPNVDDGSESISDSIELLKEFESLGFQKIITTPHIMNEFFPNNKEIIYTALNSLQEELNKQSIHIKIEAAAEYYLDEHFFESLIPSDDLLTFGKNYILMETPFLNAPFFLKEAIFNLKSKGYQVILAHPERYMYLHNNLKLVEELKDMGTLFQVNTASLSGFYSKAVQKFAVKLFKNRVVDFIGSDCHNMYQMQTIKKTLKSKIYQGLPFDDLLNNSLLVSE